MPYWPVSFADENTRPFFSETAPRTGPQPDGRFIGSMTHRSFETPQQCLEYICPESPGLKCRECGDYVDTHFYGKEALLKNKLCLHCQSWSNIKLDERSVIANGVIYTIGPRTSPSNSNGFAGQKFVIAMNDGRVIETCDLWHGGKVRPPFRNRFPDNAVFLDPPNYSGPPTWSGR